MNELSVTVPIINDVLFEFQEQFFGTLVSTVGAVTLNPERATVLIVDDDGMFLSGICVCQLMHSHFIFKLSFSFSVTGLNDLIWLTTPTSAVNLKFNNTSDLVVYILCLWLLLLV